MTEPLVRRRMTAAAVVLGLTAALLAACNRGTAPQSAAPAAPPPQAVGVVAVAKATVPMTTELPGRVEALRTAQVRSRVTGIVQKRLFREGSDVKAGEPLFRIDPAPYEAALSSAQAQLARAQANLAQAQALAARYRPLHEAHAISEQEFVAAQAGEKQAQADVMAGKAAVETARLNLGYATVRAPISGRIGRALVSEGQLVSQTEATQMALIQQVNPVYVNLTQSVSELRRLREAVSQGQAAAVDSVPVHVVDDEGQPLAPPGRLVFSELSVDPTSGEVLLRAEVPNPGVRLLPGMYVRVRLAQAQLEGVVLLPQQAVTRSAQGDSVLVVGADDKVQPRPVRIDGARGNQWIVLSGLQAGDRVVVEGLQKVRPGAPVKPVPWAPAASAPASAASS